MIIGNEIGRHAVEIEAGVWLYHKMYEGETQMALVDLNRPKGDTVLAAALRRGEMVAVLSCEAGYEQVAATAFEVSVADLVASLAAEKEEADE